MSCSRKTRTFVSAIALVVITLATTGLFALPAGAATVLFTETFNTDVPNTAGFNAQYPAFTTSGPDPISVVSGVATITNGTGSNNTTTATIPGYSQDISISADIGALSSSGNYNVGFRIGANNIIFHPGHGGGALRVEGPGGFGNTNMGFTPPNGVLHHLEVHQHPGGLFDITLTDGSNPLNVFNTSFTNLGSVGGAIGLRRSGPTVILPGQGLFDNFLVTTDTAIPEPPTNLALGKTYAYSVLPTFSGGTHYKDDAHVQTVGVFDTGDLTDGVIQPPGASVGVGQPIVGWGDPVSISTEIVVDLGVLHEVSGVTLGTHTFNASDNGAPDGVDVSFSTTGTAAVDFGSLVSAAFVRADVPGDGHHDLPPVAIPGTLARYVKLAFDGGGVLGPGASSHPPNKWMLDEITILGAAPPAIPEPMTMLAVGLGITSLGGYIRKRRRA